jgi:carotenoid cleavage dioxygenase-like enzyme
VLNPLRLAYGDRPFIESYRWEPERGTRFRVIDRRDGRLVRSVEGEPFFCFHHVNAWDEGDDVVIDLLAYPDASVIDALYLDRLRSPEPRVPISRLRRYRLAAGRTEALHEPLVDTAFELPRIDYARRNGRPHRFVWGAGWAADSDSELAPDWFDALVKVDVASGEVRRWHAPGCYPGEPMLAHAPAAEGEDEGAILSVVLDAERGGSFLLVLDASTLDELGRAAVPAPVPFGFHGHWFGDEL